MDSNIHAVAGSAYGALSAEEIQQAMALYVGTKLTEAQIKQVQNQFEQSSPEQENMSDTMSRVSSALSYHFNALSDPSRSPKYEADFNVANLAGGCLSVEPLFGRFIFANAGNEETTAVFRADGKNSHMFSSSTATTLGSPNIDTTNGYDMNFLSDVLPSSVVTPVKTWMYKLFPLLTDKRLIYVAMMQGMLILLGKFIESRQDKRTLSEQIESKDLATIIVDNQEIENDIIASGRT